MPADSGLDQEKAGGEKKRMLQMWLDQNQYSRKGILRYEAIFGRTYVSVGGEETTKDFCSKLCLTPGMKVLDIGCGTGGSAFYMARRYVTMHLILKASRSFKKGHQDVCISLQFPRYGVDVHGVDLASNMIAIAQDYRLEMEPEVKHRVQFYIEDATAMSYPKNFYDVVYR